jgi:hypothetical protein
MSMSTYFRPNIHQNGLENLGVKGQDILTKTLHIIELSVKYSKESTKTLCMLKIGTKVVEVE